MLRWLFGRPACVVVSSAEDEDAPSLPFPQTFADDVAASQTEEKTRKHYQKTVFRNSAGLIVDPTWEDEESEEHSEAATNPANP